MHVDDIDANQPKVVPELIPAMNRFIAAAKAGSRQATDELRQFVLGVISEYNHDWLYPIFVRCEQELIKHLGDQESNKVLIRLRGQWSGALLVDNEAESEEARSLLRWCVDKYGVPLLCSLARMLADLMDRVWKANFQSRGAGELTMPRGFVYPSAVQHANKERGWSPDGTREGSRFTEHDRGTLRIGGGAYRRVLVTDTRSGESWEEIRFGTGQKLLLD